MLQRVIAIPRLLQNYWEIISGQNRNVEIYELTFVHRLRVALARRLISPIARCQTLKQVVEGNNVPKQDI